LNRAKVKKTSVALALISDRNLSNTGLAGKGFKMKPVCDTLHVARSNIAERRKAPLAKPKVGRKALPEDELLAQIKAEIKAQPSYGYHRIWAVLRRKARMNGLPTPNHKRIYRVMKAHSLLLSRHAGGVGA